MYFKIHFNAWSLSLFNHFRIGVGEKSETLTTKTQGVEPTIPEPQSFLEVSPGSVTLHLNAWENGGCPIVYFVVEYKPR